MKCETSTVLGWRWNSPNILVYFCLVPKVFTAVPLPVLGGWRLSCLPALWRRASDHWKTAACYYLLQDNSSYSCHLGRLSSMARMMLSLHFILLIETSFTLAGDLPQNSSVVLEVASSHQPENHTCALRRQTSSGQSSRNFSVTVGSRLHWGLDIRMIYYLITSLKLSIFLCNFQSRITSFQWESE